MMNADERVEALKLMRAASTAFYMLATRIGNHPFIEFTGLMNEYIKVCEQAHEQGIDFSDCSAHTGIELPLMGYHLNYINEKLECIYGGRIGVVMPHKPEPPADQSSLAERIERACVAACTCLEKTPQWEHHEINCRYRLLQEAAEALREDEQVLDLRWKADMRAIKRWQTATGRTLTWPDHADLVVWLLEQLDAAEGKAATKEPGA